MKGPSIDPRPRCEGCECLGVNFDRREYVCREGYGPLADEEDNPVTPTACPYRVKPTYYVVPGACEVIHAEVLHENVVEGAIPGTVTHLECYYIVRLPDTFVVVGMEGYTEHPTREAAEEAAGPIKEAWEKT